MKNIFYSSVDLSFSFLESVLINPVFSFFPCVACAFVLYIKKPCPNLGSWSSIHKLIFGVCTFGSYVKVQFILCSFLYLMWAASPASFFALSLQFPTTIYFFFLERLGSLVENRETMDVRLVSGLSVCPPLGCITVLFTIAG